MIPSKTLNISSRLDSSHEEQLIQVLREYFSTFSWDYIDMKGIHPNTYTYHIYIHENFKNQEATKKNESIIEGSSKIRT